MKKLCLGIMSVVFVMMFSASYVFAQAPSIDTTKYIILTVTQGDSIELEFIADVSNTHVKVVSGSWDTILTAGASFTGSKHSCMADSTIMTIYGDINYFFCSHNGSKITALDASHNTSLITIHCYDNQLTNLNVSGLTDLKILYCNYNQLTNLDVSELTNLMYFGCSDNQLTNLDISHLTNLIEYDCQYNQLTSIDISHLTNLMECVCSSNQLTSLDVSHLTNLTYLYCNNNQLTSLDVNGLTKLEVLDCENNQLTSLNISGLTSKFNMLSCNSNQFTTQAIDNIFCQLPDRTHDEYGVIKIADYPADPIVLATNKNNATDKNWEVQCYQVLSDNWVDFPQTNGTYVCGSESLALEDAENTQINLYPNPAKDEIVIKGVQGQMIKIFDINGKLVKQEIIKEKLDIKDLANGVYYLQVKDITTKLIKQ